MANILIHPNSGIIEFSTGTAGGGLFNPNFTGGAFASRLNYDNYGGLNFTSYVSNPTGLDRFSVDGANGRLFSVTDNLSGSLFSVNDIAGLPIIEAFDDNTVIMGAFNRNDFIITGNSVGIGALPNTGTQKLFVSGNFAVSGSSVFSVRPTVNGTGVLLSGEAATLQNLATTGSTLDTKINSLSGTLTSTYATIANLASTGSTLQTNINTVATNLASTGAANLARINSLSGTLTSTYATIANLASTGSTLQTNINTVATNLASTGAANLARINSLSGTLTSTYATIANLATTGSTLNTRINNLSGYINSTGSNIVFTTGNQTITGQKIFQDKLLVGLTTPDAATPDNILQTNSLTISGVDLTAGGQVPSTIIKGGIFLGKSDGSLGILTNSNSVWGPTAFEFAGVNFDVTAYNNMYFTAGYLPQFWLDTNGNVGIDTAYPTERLEVNGNVLANNLVYNTSDQTIDGTKTFQGSTQLITKFVPGGYGGAFGLEVYGADEDLSAGYGGTDIAIGVGTQGFAIKYSASEFDWGQPILVAEGGGTVVRPTSTITFPQSVGISGAFETSRSRKFIYSGESRGPASRTTGLVYNNIAYGANCTITPRHRGTIKAEASVGLTVPSQTADTIQAATFWYGTGTPPVFSGNLNDLNNINRIGGIKGVPQPATTPTLQLSPIGASWVAEVTGLTTGTRYWFDIAMSGRFLRVQDVQIYLEEIY
jgi:hypothetical protein